MGGHLRLEPEATFFHGQCFGLLLRLSDSLRVMLGRVQSIRKTLLGSSTL